MSFTKKQLKIRFDIQQNTDDGGKSAYSMEFSGLRIHAEIKVAPHSVTSQANIIVFGLSANTMNSLTLVRGIGQNIAIYTGNRVVLFSVDEDGNDSLVFDGTIMQAMADYNRQPAVPMHIFATSFLRLAISQPKPFSMKGTCPVPAICHGILEVYNQNVKNESEKYTLEDNGVDAVLTDPAFDGSYLTMLNRVCVAAGVMGFVEGNKFVISTGDKERNIPQLEISGDTGLIGYPVIIPNGCIIRAEYSPYYRLLAPILVKSKIINFQKGLAKKIDTILEGRFTLFQLSHKLQSETPGGLWQSEMRLVYLHKEERGKQPK
ncbi:MAG: hypothetical protein NC112_09045 [Oxalobacter formigenes]|nr:hypothetical protein [Oxalobacter formigenes]